MFMLIDSRQYVFLFDDKGRFISSSDSCRGEGPKDYLMAIDAVYNPYRNTIEVYSPAGEGILHCYDLSFNWIENRKLPKQDGFAAMKFDCLSESIYAFEPVFGKEEDFVVRICDFSENASLPSEDVFLVEDGYVSTLTMMQKTFSRCGATLYYTPYYMDYHFYEYNLEQKSFKPIYELDLGSKVTKEFLDDKLENRQSDAAIADVLWGKCEYLLSSQYLLPIIRMINDSFVYVCCIRERETNHLIYNRKTRKTYFLPSDAQLKMHRCYALQENVLGTILFPYELGKYVNEESKRYMSEETLQRLKVVRDEDNPVVVKYYLKK